MMNTDMLMMRLFHACRVILYWKASSWWWLRWWWWPWQINDVAAAAAEGGNGDCYVNNDNVLHSRYSCIPAYLNWSLSSQHLWKHSHFKHMTHAVLNKPHKCLASFLSQMWSLPETSSGSSLKPSRSQVSCHCLVCLLCHSYFCRSGICADNDYQLMMSVLMVTVIAALMVWHWK